MLLHYSLSFAKVQLYRDDLHAIRLPTLALGKFRQVPAHFFKVEKMNMKIEEQQDVRTVQTLIDEAKSMGLRVVHRPDPVKAEVIDMESRRMQMCVSPEAA